MADSSSQSPAPDSARPETDAPAGPADVGEAGLEASATDGASDTVAADEPTTERPAVIPGPSVWDVLGRGVRAAGRGLSSAVQAVDSDVRADLARAPLLGLTLLTARHRTIKPVPDDGHRPLVLVHGLGGHRGNFAPMRGWLALRGRRRSYSIGLPDDPLAELGHRLVETLAKVVEVNGLGPEDRIDIVAHSMGGLVSRLALLDVETTNRVHTLVTLGTPHSGTHAARFAGSGRARDLRPDSDVLERLAGQSPWAGPTRLVCLWSRADPLMQPAETARMPGAEHVELPEMTHLQYLLDRRAWREVAAALST